ncbi:MAG: pantoate--beta-alanine ligase [Verrucomicrobia bacterium]|nr:pantoate--beta-alanine ligase [Verrucomicrobiota bacterium]
MRVVTSVAAMQRLTRKLKAQGVQFGFVPTMGYLHAGHISLVKRARQLVGKTGQVVVSIYVNPTQFAPTEDLSKYPRDLAQDKQMCRDAGVDILFVPSDTEMYPAEFSTYVVEEKLSRRMEGASRPTHFRGVTSVVAKLFNIVLPDVSVFGAKDFQQAAVIQRMVRDLHFPVKVVVAPTHRERDGLAMSSRNKYLNPMQRDQATVLWLAMELARKQVKSRSVAVERLRSEISKLIATQSEARLDYVEFFDRETLEPVEMVKRGTQMALAVFVGKTRLIDNGTL